MAKGMRGAFVLMALLTLVMTALGSLLLGYEFGQTALEGVSSPEGDDTATGDTPQMATLRRGIPLVEETLVLSAARILIEPPSDRLVSNAPVATLPTPTPTPTPTPEASPTLAAPPPLNSGEITPLAFPTSEPEIAATTPPPVFEDTSVAAGQVSMQVLSANRQGDQVVLTVSLSNSSDRVVRFLYSFMNVTDDQGRPVSASTQGLPGELPPNGQSYQGTITIPSLFLQGSSTVSLNLPDYPSQNFRLQVNGIPIQ